MCIRDRDEATQILEPQLLGILCAKFADERNAVGKFILIGDHKPVSYTHLS